MTPGQVWKAMTPAPRKREKRKAREFHATQYKGGAWEMHLMSHCSVPDIVRLGDAGGPSILVREVLPKKKPRRRA